MSEKKQVILTISILFLVLAIALGSVTFVTNYNVYADELQPNALLNFNQQFNYFGRTSLYNVSFSVGSNVIHIEGTANNNGYAYVNGTVVSTGSNTFLANHKYYVDIKSSDEVSNIGLYNGGWHATATGRLQTLIVYPEDRVRYVTIQLVNGVSYNTDLQCNIIDLTLMYGVGNEPDLDQCKSTFITYYAYTISSYITFDNISSYSQGYNSGVSDTLKNFDYNIIASDSYNYFTGGSVNYDGRSIIGITSKDDLVLGHYAVNVTSGQPDVDGFSSCGVFPLFTTIAKGTTLSFKGYFLSRETSPSPIYIGYLNGTDFIILDSVTPLRESWKYYEKDLVLPVDINSLYFVYIGNNSSSFKISDFELSTKINNIGGLISTSNKNGYDRGFEDGKNSINLYAIKQAEYNRGLADANKYSFLQLLGAVVDAPLSVFSNILDFEILGYNMRSFVLSIISIAIIITIIRIIIGAKNG